MTRVGPPNEVQKTTSRNRKADTMGAIAAEAGVNHYGRLAEPMSFCRPEWRR